MRRRLKKETCSLASKLRRLEISVQEAMENRKMVHDIWIEKKKLQTQLKLSESVVRFCDSCH